MNSPFWPRIIYRANSRPNCYAYNVLWICVSYIQLSVRMRLFGDNSYHSLFLSNVDQ